MNEGHAIAALRAVHEAALVPEMWPNALDAIAAACRANFAVAQAVGADGHNFITTPNGDALTRAYFEGGWHVGDPRMERGLALTKNGFRGLVTEWHSFTQEELERLPYQHEFARSHGAEHEAGILLASEAGTQFILTILRSQNPGAFYGRELEQMNDLIARLKDAFSFALRLKLDSAIATAETISSLGSAVAVLTATGRVLHLSEEFATHLKGPLTVRDGRIRAVRPFEDTALQASILRAARQHSAGGLPALLLRRRNDKPLLVRCLPVAGAARDLMGLARVILAVDDPAVSAEVPAAKLLTEAFGLTQAEARFASRIGAGETVSDSAKAEGISIETARKRLKMIFRKTETSRQAELALLISRLTA